MSTVTQPLQASLCPPEHQPLQLDHCHLPFPTPCGLTAPSGGPALISVVPSVRPVLRGCSMAGEKHTVPALWNQCRLEFRHLQTKKLSREISQSVPEIVAMTWEVP